MNLVEERNELCELYLEFLSLCLKTYFFASDLIDKEVESFTNNELKDGWIFFLLVFSHSVNLKKVKDIKSLKLYVQDPEASKIVLTNKGQDLAAYLNKKIELHASILRFNGISFYDLIGDIDSMSKMMKFWKILTKSSN